MANKEKILELISRLDSLQSKEIIPNGNIDELIKTEISDFADKLKSNPSIKALKDFQEQLNGFKKEFDLKPLTSLLKEVQQEMIDNQTSLVDEFSAKMEDIKNSIPVLPPEKEDYDDSQLKLDITNLRDEFSKRLIALPFAKLEKKLNAFKTELQNYQSKDEEEDEKNNKTIQLQFVAFEKQVKDLKLQFQKHGGGSMPPKISINGVVISTRYADINFKAGNNVTLTKADNNTTHQVDFTITSSGSGGSSTFVNNEIVSGSGTAWTLAQTPLAGVQHIYAQGIRLYPGTDPNFGYSITGTSITTQQSYSAGDLIADYQTS